MRYAARVDANQTQIVSALRAAGATVQSLSAVGQGCPDLLVGYRGTNILMEIKDGKKSPSDRKLTSDQIVWHSEWNGVVFLVTNVNEALQLLREKI
jgi:Holliday junction resolvase